MCTHFKNVYAFQITFCVHNLSLIINDLTQCVQYVRDVHPFLSCFRHFSKTRFYFINRTSIWNYPVHTVHTATTPITTGFLPFQSAYTSAYTVRTHGPKPRTHLHLLYIYTVSMSTNRGPRTMFHDFVPQSAILRISAPPKRLKEALDIIFKPTHTPLSKTNPRWESSFFLKSVDRRLWKTRYCLYFT